MHQMNHSCWPALIPWCSFAAQAYSPADDDHVVSQHCVWRVVARRLGDVLTWSCLVMQPTLRQLKYSHVNHDVALSVANVYLKHLASYAADSRRGGREVPVGALVPAGRGSEPVTAAIPR